MDKGGRRKRSSQDGHDTTGTLLDDRLLKRLRSEMAAGVDETQMQRKLHYMMGQGVHAPANFLNFGGTMKTTLGLDQILQRNAMQSMMNLTSKQHRNLIDNGKFPSALSIAQQKGTRDGLLPLYDVMRPPIGAKVSSGREDKSRKSALINTGSSVLLLQSALLQSQKSQDHFTATWGAIIRIEHITKMARTEESRMLLLCMCAQS